MRTAVGVIFALTAISAASTAKIVCYYASWASNYEGIGRVIPEDLDTHICTHINYAFVHINSSGSLSVVKKNLDITKRGYTRTTALKEKNPNLKVLLSVGGASSPAEMWADVAANAEKRAAMVASARWFIETYNFDGVDLDWEIPKSADRANFIALLQDFRTDFDRNGWLLTAAVRAVVSEGYDVAKMSQLLDHINVMTYSMSGPWSQYTGQNSPLYASSIESKQQKANLNMAAAVQQWIDAGASLSKLVPGIPFYGRTFTLADPSNNGLHAPITGPGRAGPIRKAKGVLVYLGFCQTRNSWNCTWDDEQKVPICVNGDQWLGINTEQSIKEKVDFIRSKGLGGAMIWSVDQDDVHGHCGEAKPLLRTIANNLLNMTKI